MINKVRIAVLEIPTLSNAIKEQSAMIFSKINPPVGFYVYAYLRKDNSPYYIGKGKSIRAVESHSVAIPKQYDRIIIIEQNLSEIGAFALERRLIRWYGRKDNGTGILRNRTEGGEGTTGYKFTSLQKNRMSKAHAGKILTDQHRNAISTGKLGKPLPHVTLHCKGKKNPKISESMRGKNTDKKQLVECPYCHKIGGGNAMKQWHFNRCKLSDK